MCRILEAVVHSNHAAGTLCPTRLRDEVVWWPKSEAALQGKYNLGGQECRQYKTTMMTMAGNFFIELNSKCSLRKMTNSVGSKDVTSTKHIGMPFVMSF